MPAPSPPPFSVEPSPAGGFRIMLRGHDRPVSRHDTEEEAVERMAAYLRGWHAPPAETEKSAPSP
jgi:hypothetical protein